MSLAVSEERALTGIEQALLSRDPRLKSLFTIFTRLTRHEAMPTIEQLRRRHWWSAPGAVILVALVLAVVGTVVFSLAMPARACSPTQRQPVTAGPYTCTPVTSSRSVSP
jgi:hypothetical protein